VEMHCSGLAFLVLHVSRGNLHTSSADIIMQPPGVNG